MKFFKRRMLPLGAFSDYIASLQVVRRLQEAGYRAYFVGGCVRDLILGFVPKDWDISTDASYEELLNLFPYPGHGKVTKKFLVHAFRVDGKEIEVAQFRKDLGASRNDPATPTSNIRDDAVRRDFTFNAIYWDPVANKLTDPVGGVDDLLSRRLRTPGDPTESFSQDPIRVLRGLYFVRKYNLKDDVGLEQFLPLLASASRGRVEQELKKRGLPMSLLQWAA